MGLLKCMQSSMFYFDAPGVKVNIRQAISFWNQPLWSLFHCCSTFNCSPYEGTFSMEWFLAPISVGGTCLLEGCVMTWDKIPPGFGRIDSAQELPYWDILLWLSSWCLPIECNGRFVIFYISFVGMCAKYSVHVFFFLFHLPLPPKNQVDFSLGVTLPLL